MPADCERTEGPTPNGGAYALARFTRDGAPAPKEHADAVEIVEYNSADREIFRTYARIGFAALVIALCASLTAVAGPEPLHGANNTGPQWPQGADGSWRGTGENFGRGYRSSDGGRQLHGTGKDFGRGWRRGADGVWHGTGENFGKGWVPRSR